jgi:hypothetical protein
MSYPYGPRRSRATYAETAHSHSTGDVPLAFRVPRERRQVVEHPDMSSDSDARNQSPGNELPQRPSLRDRHVQTDHASHGLPAIEWPGSGGVNDADYSRQVVRSNVDEGEYDGDDGPSSDRDRINYRNDREDRRRSTRLQGQSFRRDPVIANFVRSEAQRKSSQGRKLFSPSGLQNSEKATTRQGDIEYPLLPISDQHTSKSLSQSALDFAEIESGDFAQCVKFLRQHASLLGEGENYHLYIQEAWQALWDGEKHYAHRCLSRWFLLDECRNMRPGDVDKHINQRGFSGKKLMDKVDSMYRTLKTLRKQILLEREQAANRALGHHNNAASTWSFNRVQAFFQGADGLKVLSNVGEVCNFVMQVKRSLGGKTEM